ncbi:MAG: hypothetical protein QXE34_03290 [Candidatus Aenigmatarchaeota archaeon]
MKKIYVCKICGIKYNNRIDSKKCEKCCKEKKCCNIDLYKKAIN